jgi:superfamily II DNA or RNA helicase
MYLGDICNTQSKKEEQDNVLVKAINYNIYDDDEYNETERDYRGNIKYSCMISKVVKCNYRSDFIVNVMLNELSINNNQQILLLAHQRSLLNYIFKSLENKNMLDVGYYVGGMKDKDLKISENRKILLATYQMAAEGLDIKSLTTLILATPKSDIVQSVGRILREKHEEPLIIDIVDQHDCFISQFNKRKVFYNEKNYKIIKTDNHKYIDYFNKKDDRYKNDIWSEIVKREKKSTKKCINQDENFDKISCQCLI